MQMKKSTAVIAVLLCVVLLVSLAACAGRPASEAEKTTKAPTTEGPIDAASVSQGAETQTVPAESTAAPSGQTAAPKAGILVVYFSRTGEQYGVGVIDEGNTAIVAKAIAEQTGADLFEILPETDYYPYTYSKLTDVAKQEQKENARPAIRDALPDLSQYDTVFIGAPVWWGDWPMILYTFFETAELSGKTLIPFSTHEGSGLSGFDRKLASACPNSTVLDGLAIRGSDCQNDRSGVGSKVRSWLDKLGY